MKVLITGTDGYIGTQLAPLLLARGHDVTGVDSGFYRAGWLYHGVQKFAPAISKDIRHITEEELAGFDAVVHMAELSNDPLGKLNPGITYEINHKGSVDLAQKCKNVGITRFVYTSSCSVYGAGENDWKNEESTPNPQTAYARCKVLVEQDVSRLASPTFSPTFLRNATAYGASPRMRFDIVLNNLAGLAWTTKEIKLISDGTPWRPLVHVLDICEAIASTLEAPRETIHNQIFNVGKTEENYQIREVAQIVAEAFPGCKLTVGKSDGDNRSYRVSFDKIERELDFECQRTLAMGAAEFYELFKRIDLSPEMFRWRAYTRLEQLKYLIRTEQLNDELFWND